MRFSATAVLVMCKMICEFLCEECKQSEYAIFGMMLRGHTYKKLNVSIPFECLPACNDDFRCHSFNYVISLSVCELNNRSKEATPENFIPNSERYYFIPNKERVTIGSIPEFPARTCKEIKLNEGGQAVSGEYWFDSVIPGKTILVPCDMETEDADECRASLPVCDVNATCQNTPRSYICICDAGLTGDGKTCTDFDECNVANPLCDVNANCQNNHGSYACTCKTGFAGDGKTCSDVDECSDPAMDCDANANCQNSDGSYSCFCKAGFSGDGKTCADVDECSTAIPLCDVNANCQNNDGSYICSCNAGYTGDGETCNDVDECTGSALDCDVNADCQNTDGSYVCSCDQGFTGDGKSCTDIDECSASSPVCDVNSDCQNTGGSYGCTCKPGFSGDGQTCIGTTCSAQPSDRVGCPGSYGGISRAECQGLGCCFDDSISNAIWCFVRPVAACAAVGVEDPNQISDAQMTASSNYLLYYPYKGRLNGDTGWCQGTSTISNDYLQVDMGAVRTVCAVATQGKKNGSYVTSYKLSLSADGVNWSTYKEGNVDKVFQANTDLNTIVQHTLNNAAQARYVRFYPVSRSGFPCMRVELFVQ